MRIQPMAPHSDCHSTPDWASRLDSEVRATTAGRSMLLDTFTDQVSIDLVSTGRVSTDLAYTEAHDSIPALDLSVLAPFRGHTASDPSAAGIDSR